MRVIRGGAAATREALGADGRHVLALWGLPCGEWARRAARARNVAYSVWLLGSDVWSLGRIPFVRGALARVVREASRAYADGYRLGEDASALSGAHVGFLPSTREIEPASDALPRAQAPFRLLFLGRWHPNKGIDLLLDALSLLGDDDWARIEHVRIEGGGPLRPLVEKKVRELKARERPVRLDTDSLAHREHSGRLLGRDEAGTPRRRFARRRSASVARRACGGDLRRKRLGGSFRRCAAPRALHLAGIARRRVASGIAAFLARKIDSAPDSRRLARGDVNRKRARPAGDSRVAIRRNAGFS
jgi:hypothetical protein